MNALYKGPLKPCTASCSQQWRAPGLCKSYEIHSLATERSRKSFCYQNRMDTNRNGLCMWKEKECYPQFILDEVRSALLSPEHPQLMHPCVIPEVWKIFKGPSSHCWQNFAESWVPGFFLCLRCGRGMGDHFPTQWESLSPTHLSPPIWFSHCWKMLFSKHNNPFYLQETLKSWPVDKTS